MKLPKGWKMTRFGEVATFRNGLNFVLSDSGDVVPVVGVKDFQKHFSIGYETLEQVQIAGRLSEDDLLRNDDLLFVRSNGNKALVGRCLLIKNISKRISFSGFTIRARLTSADMYSTFLGYFFHSGNARREIDQAGGGTNISNLSQDILASIGIPLPPLPEQHKIAEILSAWDDGLEKLDALIAAKERSKKGLMQQLLTGKRRVKGFSGKWQNYCFKDLLAMTDRYVKFDDGHTYKLISVRRRSGGVFFREALKGQDILTKTMKKVYVNDFLISRMQVVHGALGMVRKDCDGMYVSDSYEVLVAVDPENLYMPFFDWLSRQRSFWQLTLICSHGVHIEKMTFNLEDFMRKRINIPADVNEQCAIADILDACDDELRLLRAQRGAFDQQKRGLMQRLLTGAVRVRMEKYG